MQDRARQGKATFSVNNAALSLSNSGHGFCVTGSRIFRETWVTDIACYAGGIWL